jgi:hypothetical protein
MSMLWKKEGLNLRLDGGNVLMISGQGDVT